MKKSIIDLLRPLLLLFLAVRMAPVSASSAGVAPQRDTTISREAARCPMRTDTISPSALPDSVVRRLARELGMVDTAEVAPQLRRLHYIETHLLPLVDTASLRRSSPRYLRRRERTFRQWMRLIPNQTTLQYAGSIGLMSAGIGWHYGRHDHWETDFLIGFLPRYHSEHAKSTFTLKQRYVPWHVVLGSRWTFQPLTTGLFFNTISGDDFWRNEPDKYPKRYYGFSTKVRSNVFIGQRWRYSVPTRKRRLHSAISAYYELSSCDLYIVSKAVNHDYPWSRTLSLAFGLRWEM